MTFSGGLLRYDALETGATREEIADALGVAILMSGGTGVVYATHAIEAVDQFLDRKTADECTC